MKNFSRRLAMIFFIIIICATAANAQTLIPGGQVIGLQLRDDTLTVTAFDETIGNAARSAGLAKGDRILRIDDTQIRCPEDIRNALSRCDGTVDISIRRGEKTKTLTFSPPLTKDGPKLGVYLRQGTAGLGTVTYYDPVDGSFAALGHGVNSADGNLLQLTDGSVFPARIYSVKKGKAGAPGQLMGSAAEDTPFGSIQKNTQQGVFGHLTTTAKATPLTTAKPKEVKTGSATIRSTIKNNELQEYSVEILKIYPNTAGRTRNLLLKITDQRLLDATGGIVQGMSGSPIIQNGKLVGAVTHVLVNDPTTGYGIFIENMLNAA